MDGEEKVKSGLTEKGTLRNKVEGIKIGFLDDPESFGREKSLLIRWIEI
jgi:hypothetical protein